MRSVQVVAAAARAWNVCFWPLADMPLLVDGLNRYDGAVHATARIHHIGWRHGGNLADCGTRAATSLPVIGFLHSATASAYAPMTAAFRKSLNEAGYVEGQNVLIEYRWADGQFDRLPALATDLVNQQVSVIFAGGGSDPSLAAKAATSKIPIVFANGTDPVEAELVGSLDHPGANITGITFLLNTLGPKEFEVLHELVPKAPLRCRAYQS